MKLNAFRNAATLAFSVTFAGAVMAQTPSPSTPPTPQTTPQTTRPAQDSQRQDSLKGMIGQTVTLSGCLSRDTASAGTTTTATPGATGAGADFILTNVQVRSGAPTAGATPGATPSTPSATATTGPSSAMRVKLKASGTTDLSENVNKRVEVTGRLQEGSDSTSARPGATAGSPGTPGAPGTPGTPETGAPKPSASGAMGATPELQVTNVRVLEQSCTPGK